MINIDEFDKIRNYIASNEPTAQSDLGASSCLGKDNDVIKPEY